MAFKWNFDRDFWSKVPIIGRSVESNAEIAAKQQMQEQLRQVAAKYRNLTYTVPEERIEGARGAASAFDNSSAYLNNMSGGQYKPNFDEMFVSPNVQKMRGE